MSSRADITGLIISAGLSGRMQNFKPLALYKGKSFLLNIVLKLSRYCKELFIVTGFRAEELQTALINDLNLSQHSGISQKIKFVYNESFEKGMFTSLKKGISAAGNCNWIFYHFVDQPAIPEMFYEEFIPQADNNFDWIQPTVNGQKGHPVLIGSHLLEKISDAPSSSNLRTLIKDPEVKIKYWECKYPEILQDIDTPFDYEALTKSD